MHTQLLSFIFFASGIASLIYQVAWQRLLTLHYGVGHLSTTLIVSVFMLGLGSGAYFGSSYIEKAENKIFCYFLIEFALGCFGLFSFKFLSLLGEVTAGSSYWLSFIYIFIFLSFPTFLMGMTLPLIVKIYNQFHKNFAHSISYLYFINTVGAAFGSLFASYFLISLFGLDQAVYFAAAINFTLSGCIFLLIINKHNTESNKNIPLESISIYGTLSINTASLLVFITGFIAIGYEIVWFRFIGNIVKSSPYVFSSVLFVYLLGIGSGAYIIEKIITKWQSESADNLFFVLQCLVGIAGGGTFLLYYYLSKHSCFFHYFTYKSFTTLLHPEPVFNLNSASSLKGIFWQLYGWLDIFGWSFLFLFIPTVLMGASFPLLSCIALNKKDSEAVTIGRIYGSNVAGNLMGGLFTGLVLLPFLGTANTVLLFSLISISFGWLIRYKISQWLLVGSRVIVLSVVFLFVLFFPSNDKLYGIVYPDSLYGAVYPDMEKHFDEGMNGLVMTCQANKKIWW
ncbi:MAG: hypothetical protein D3906_01920 [Candidatus Electrothrix sp. AUS1_2]|nr:hypothetical protein [Candidatus Electrothrix sp. AUS1_2]